MIAKNNRQLRFEKNSEKRQRFAIKKLSVGVASVLVGLAIYGGQTAHASTEDVPSQANGESQNATQPQATNNAVKAVALQNVGGGVQASSNDSNTSGLASLSPAQDAVANSAVTTDIPHNNELKPNNNSISQAEPVKANSNEDLGEPNKQIIQDNKQKINRVNKNQAVVLAAQAASSEETVTDAPGFIDALNKHVSVINVNGDFSLKDQVLPSLTGDLTIKSLNGTRHKIDFNNDCLDGGTHNVTFENIDLYDLSNMGLVTRANSVIFDNVNFKGETLLHDGASNIVFKNVVNATSDDYQFNGQSIDIGKDEAYWALIFGSYNITFETGSNVNLTTVACCVMDSYYSGILSISIKHGATVQINGHYGPKRAPIHGDMYEIIGGNSAGVGNFNLEGNLIMNTIQTANDLYAPNCIYEVPINIKNGGHLTVNSKGTRLRPIFEYSNVNVDGVGSALSINANNFGTSILVNRPDDSPITVSNGAELSTSVGGTDSGVAIGKLVLNKPGVVNVDLTSNTNPSSKAIANSTISVDHGKTSWDNNIDPTVFNDMNISFDASGNPYINNLVVDNQQAVLADPNHYLKRFYLKAEDVPTIQHDVPTKVNIASDSFDLTTDHVIGDVTADNGNDDILVNILFNQNQVWEQDHPNGYTNDYQHIVNNTEPRYTTKTVDDKGHFSVDLTNYANQITDGTTITIQAMKNGVKAQDVTITFTDIKKAAKEEIEKAKNAAEAAIQAMTDLKDKDKYTKMIDQAAIDAEKQLETTRDLNAINNIKAPAIVKINQDATKAEVRAEADKVEKNFVNWTDPDKTNAINKVETTEQQAETTIDAKNTQQEINTAKDAGKLQLDKDGANAAIDHEVKIITDGLSKDADKTQITAAATAAHNAINSETNQTAINNDQVNGILNIDKAGAIASVEDAAKKATDALKTAPALAGDQQTINNAAAKIQADKTAAEAKINATNATAQDMAKAAADGINKINREQAKAEIEHAASLENEKINHNDQLADKAEAVNKVKQDVAQAEKAIDDASDSQAVDKVKTAGVNKISLENAKATAREKVTQEAMQATNTVNAMQPLTKKEQASYDAQIETKKSDALAKIDNAEDSQGITNAVTNGITSIDRESAKAAIDNEAEKVTQKIAALPNVDETAKTAAEDNVKRDQEQYKQQIDNETETDTQDKVNKAREAGIQQIDADGNVVTKADQAIQTAKDEAKKAIEDAKNKAKADIENQQLMPGLSDDERKAAEKRIDDEAQQAENNITNAKGNEAVKQAKDAGTAKISNEEAKAKANDAIDQTASKIKESLKNLNDKEKQVAEDQINKDIQTAHEQINGITGQSEIDKAQQDGINKLTKDGAVAEINHEANKVNDEINGLPNLDDQAKQVAKNQVSQDQQKAINDINQAADSTAVDQAKQAGIVQLDNDGKITQAKDDEINKAKQAAEKVIDSMADQAKQALDGKGLTPEEKQAAKQKITDEANKAKEVIKQAQGDDGVKQAQADGATSIKNEVAKADAKGVIDDETAKIKQVIHGLSNLTPEEKQKLEDQVDQDTAKAKAAIDNADDPTAIKEAQDQGVMQIEADGKAAKANNELNKAKEAARQTIDNEAEKVKQQVAGLPNLDPQTKAATQHQIDQDAQTAKKAIDQATGQLGVDHAKDQGIKKIDEDGAQAIVKDHQVTNNEKHQGNTPTSGNQTQEMINDQGSSKTGMTSNGQPGTIGHEQKLASANEQINVANKNHYSENRLPQTGSQDNRTVEAIGLAIATAGIMFGIGTRKRKR